MPKDILTDTVYLKALNLMLSATSTLLVTKRSINISFLITFILLILKSDFQLQISIIILINTNQSFVFSEKNFKLH